MKTLNINIIQDGVNMKNMKALQLRKLMEKMHQTKGRVHVIWLCNNAGEDGVYFKHYQVLK